MPEDETDEKYERIAKSVEKLEARADEELKPGLREVAGQIRGLASARREIPRKRPPWMGE